MNSNPGIYGRKQNKIAPKERLLAGAVLSPQSDEASNWTKTDFFHYFFITLATQT
jgi:hypothetical protein